MAENTTTAKITVDISELKRNITEANRQIRLANAEFKNASAGMKNWESTTNGLSAKINSLNKTLDNQKKVLESYNKQLEITKKEYGEDSKEATNLQVRIENQEAQIKKTTAEIERYEKELEKVRIEESKVFQTGEKLTEIGGKLESIGSTLAKTVTAGIVALGVASIKAFQEVDKGLDLVATKTGATGENLAKMQDTAKNIATTIPVSFEDAGSAVGEVATRFDVADEKLQELSTEFLKFARINNTDVSTSIDYVQKALSAFGLGAEDAGAMLDTLNKVGQDTGISVDKLAQSMVTNGSALKEMGFDASQSAMFLGKLEKSGVDSSQALTGLKMALKNATKDGKSLKDALAEMQTKIQGASSDTEAMSIAMELFGNRAGASLGKQIKDGTLNLNDLSDASITLNDNLGNVDRTFEATLDGVDKMKVAWNSVKLAGYELGKAIGSTLAPMMEKLAKWAVNLARKFEDLSPASKKVVVVLGLIASAIGPVLIAIGKMSTGIGAVMKLLPKLTTSILSVNASLLASPLTWIIGLVAVATAGAIAYASAINDEAEAEYGLNEAQKSNLDTIKQLKDGYDSMNESRQNANNTVNGEYNYIHQLKEEYNSLIDSNGQVKAGYEDRANFILTELAKALGMELSQVKELIDANGKLGESIDNIIEKKRAEALLNANESSYTEALTKRTEALNAYMKAQNDVAEAEKNWNEVQDDYNSALETYNQLLTTFGVETASRFYTANYQIFASGQKAKESLDSMKEGADLAKLAYEGYNDTILNYEGLSSAVISNDSQRIQEEMVKISNSFKTATTSNREELEQQVVDAREKLANMQMAVQQGYAGVTDEEVRQAELLVQLAEQELAKLPPIAGQQGSDAGQQYAQNLGAQSGNAQLNGAKVSSSASSGVESNSGQFGSSGSNHGMLYAIGVSSRGGDANSAGTGVSNEANKGLRSADTYSSGSFFGEGFIRGIRSWLGASAQAGAGLASEALESLRKAQKEGSPSKLTMQSGRFFGEGYEIGIAETIKSVAKMAQLLAQTAYDSINDSDFNYYQFGYDAGNDYIKGLQEATASANNVVSISTQMSQGYDAIQRQSASVIEKGVVNNYYDLTQNNTSPKALSTIDIYRRTKNQFSLLKGSTI